MAAKKKAAKATRAPKMKPEAATAAPPARAKVAKQTYEIREIEKLHLHPKNARRGNLDAIGESIEENGFYGAPIVQKSTGLVLVGNHRTKSAIEKGLKEIPVIVVDCDDETAEKIALADNRTSDLASYDNEVLRMLLEDRAKRDHGLKGTGFADADLAKLQAKVRPPETFPEFQGTVTHKYTCPKCSYEWT